MKKGMPMREAYRKAGLKPEEMDWAAMGMDIKTCAKEMNVRPRKYVASRTRPCCRHHCRWRSLAAPHTCIPHSLHSQWL